MKKEIKCPRCRRRIQKEDAYCQYCGCHVAEEKKKKRKKKIRRFLVLVIVIVLFLGILLAIAVGSQKKQIQGWKERQLEEWKQKQEKVQADEGDQSQKQNKNQNGEQSQDSQDVKEPGTMKKCANGDTVYQPAVSTVSYDEDTGLLYYENLLIVYLIENSSQEEREALAAKVDGTLVGNMSGSMNVIEILVEDTAYADLEQKAEILMEEENVLYSSTEIPMMMENTADENPWEAGEQDKKNNDHNESKPDGNDWWAEAIGAFSAWDYVDSHEQDLANVAVGIMDDGVDAEHEEFQKNGESKIHWLEDHKENLAFDHGTHVTGLIGAENNQAGIRGVADRTDLYFVSWWKEDLFSTGEYVNVTKQMIETMLSEHTACVVNNSWATVIQSREQYLKDTLIGERPVWEEKIAEFLIEKGKIDQKYELYESYQKELETSAKCTSSQMIVMLFELLLNQQERFLIVQSAGNGYDNGGVGFDAQKTGDYCGINEEVYNRLDGETHRLSRSGYSYEKIRNHILIVGAVQETEKGYQMTEFSNYGSNIDIVAPGYDVYSTITEKDDSYTEENPGHKNLRTVKNGIKYGNLSGTSMAAPLVSGSAAVLWSVAPELSAEEVKETLISTAGTARSTCQEDKREEYPMLNLKAALEKVAKKDATHVILETFYNNGEKTHDLFASEENRDQEYAVITGLDQDENVVWTIETEKSPAAEITANTEIGIYEDRYYYAHCGVIYAVRLRDGKEIWHSASSHGSMTGTDFGPDGTLYYCSFYGPDFGAIDKDGNELYEVESFYPGYYWAYEVHYEGDHVDVKMDGTPSGEETVIRVNLSDYSYSVVQE